MLKGVITGSYPEGTTFNPSSITTGGTYTLSSSSSGGSYILVTLPTNYIAGTYTGTYTVLTSVNLTLQTATISSDNLPKTTTTLISGSYPAGTTFNPPSITTTGIYTLSSSLSGGSYILVTLPNTHTAGTYSGTYTVNAAPPLISDLSYNTGGTTKFPSIDGYNVLYITSGTGTARFYPGYKIEHIFVVGGGAGGNSGYSRYQGLGGGIVDASNLSLSGSYTFDISVGNGGTGGTGGNTNNSQYGTSGSASSCACVVLSLNYTGNGGVVATTTSLITGKPFINNLYYGGSGGCGGNGSNGTNAPLGGGGGGGGDGGTNTGKNGGNGGGISGSLTGGLNGNGTISVGGDGANSPYGGGGGAGGSAIDMEWFFTYNGGTGGDGVSSSGVGLGGYGGNGGDAGVEIGGGGGGGDGGVNTGGGGGGGGGNTEYWLTASGGKGGSGIVIIKYRLNA